VKRALQRLLRVAAFLVVAALLLGIVAYLLRGPLFGRLLAQRIERELAARLGGRFTIERVEGSYVYDLALVGLRTVEAPPGALRRLDCDRAVLEFDVRRLIDGDLDAISSVLASGAVVEIDLTREGGAGGDVEPPRRLPRLELYGRVTVATEFGEVRAEGVSVNTIGTERLGLRATALRPPPRFGRGAPFAGTVERTGPRSFVLTSETPVGGVVPERVAYDGTIDARLLVAGGAVGLRVAGGEARLRGDALDLARLPPWAWPGDIEPPRQAVASFDARAVSLRPLVVEVVASAPLVLWRGVEMRDARLEARHEGGATVVRTAHAEGPGFLVDAKDVAVDPALPWLVGDIGEATVRVADLRKLEPRLDRPLSLSARGRRVAGGGFEIGEARLEGEGVELAGRGEVVPPDDPARWREAKLAATFQGIVRDFARGAYAFRGEVRVAGDLSGTLSAPGATVVVEGEGLSVEGRGVDRVRLDATVGERLEIRDLRVEAESGTLRARGEIDLETRTVARGECEIDVPDLAGFLRLFPGAPEAQGSLAGTGTIVSDATGVSGSCSLRAHGLVVGGREVGVVTARARVTDREATVEEAAAQGPWGAARARGLVRWGERWASVESLGIDAGPVHAVLKKPFRISWDGGAARTGALDFEALGGTVRGLVAVKARRLDASLRGEGIDLAALDPRIVGRATVDLRIDGDTHEIALHVPEAKLTDDAGPWAGRAAEIRLKARSGLDGTRVEQLLVAAGDALSVEGTATLPWRFDGRRLERIESVASALSLEARGRGIAAGGVSAGQVAVSVRGEGTDMKATARLADVSVHGFALPGEVLAEATLSPARASGWAVLERSALGEAEARFDLDRPVDWTRPREARAALADAHVGGEVRLRVPDLGALRRYMADLVELRGTADGTISIKGPAAAPRVEGAIHLAGIEAKPEGAMPRLSGGSGEIRVEGLVLRVESFSAELGYSPVAASGTIDLSGPTLDLRFAGTNALLLNDPSLRVRADVDLVLRGTPRALSLGGKAKITDALYTRPINLLSRGERAATTEFALFHVRRGPFVDARLDLDVTADRTIRIRTPTVWGDLSCALKIGGTGAAPAPEGRVFFSDLLVELQATVGLKVDRGEILFPVGEPFDPRLDVVARTRLKGYDIDAMLEGRVADLHLRVATRPALPEDEAVLLLVTGYTREELENKGIERAAFEKLAVLLGERLVSRLSGPRDPDERTFFDRFSLTIGRDVSRSGDDTIEAEFEASEKVFLRVERDRFDDYNGGVVWRIRFK